MTDGVGRNGTAYVAHSTEVDATRDNARHVSMTHLDTVLRSVNLLPYLHQQNVPLRSATRPLSKILSRFSPRLSSGSATRGGWFCLCFGNEFVPVDLHYSTTLDIFHYLYVNKYINCHAFKTVM